MTSKPRLLVHVSRQQIRWGDMDAFGHVNNTIYFRYMEQARLEWRYALPLEGTPYAESMRVLANASCNFIKPLVFPGDIEVRMFLSDPGRTSVESHYEIRLKDELYAEGSAKIVWIDLKTGRPGPWPEFVVAPLLRLAEAEATGC